MLNLFRYWFRVPWFCRYTITFNMFRTSIESGIHDWEFYNTYVSRFVDWGTMPCRFATFSDFRKYRKFLKQYKKIKFLLVQESRQDELMNVVYQDYLSAHPNSST